MASPHVLVGFGVAHAQRVETVTQANPSASVQTYQKTGEGTEGKGLP